MCAPLVCARVHAQVHLRCGPRALRAARYPASALNVKEFGVMRSGGPRDFPLTAAAAGHSPRLTLSDADAASLPRNASAAVRGRSRDTAAAPGRH